ncbi:MAG: DUF1003 domain-containing protein [Micromonosporaceae bacterium]
MRLPKFSSDSFGRFAEGFAQFMGTPRFLLYMTSFVIIWVAINLIGLYGYRWDPYPFILLNLFFSTQASYAAPLILLAQNRQADRDRAALEEDRRRAAMQKADTEYLARELASLRLALGEVTTRDFLRSELNRFLEDMEDRRVEQLEAEDDEVEPRRRDGHRPLPLERPDKQDPDGAPGPDGDTRHPD